jgi:lysophospholipase L1-like esterase
MWPEPKWKRQLRESVPAGALFVDPHLRWWEIDGDHLHPTAAGHRRIAEVVAGAIDAAPSREDG